MDFIVVCGVWNGFAGDGDLEEDLPVAFLYVDDTEAMNLLVSDFFLYH